MYLQMEEVGNVIFPYLTLRSKNHTIFSLRASWILESEMNSGDLNADCIKRGKKLLQVITEEQTTVHRWGYRVFLIFLKIARCWMQNWYQAISWKFIALTSFLFTFHRDRSLKFCAAFVEILITMSFFMCGRKRLIAISEKIVAYLGKWYECQI